MPPATHASERIRRLASRARTLAIVYTLVLFTATHLPSVPTMSFTWSDKVEHYCAYAILTFFVLLGWELSTGMLQAKHYFAVWLAGTLYAAIDEVTQIPVGRTCDINDWAADMLGIVAGLLVFCMLRGTLYRLLIGGDARALTKP
jgi:VanZ family protein